VNAYDFRMIEKLCAKWKGDGRYPQFVAINVGQTEDHVANFAKRLNVSFPLYMDRDGKIARGFGVKGLPTYFVIDRQGIVRHIILGWTDESVLEAEAAKIDAKPLSDKTKPDAN
jgi:cytochrome c biogenesis protein CcmG, thiol:disulfide interchange protein DsbE